MKLFKFGIKVIFIFFSYATFVYANNLLNLTVPFDDILLDPNQTIQANFSFGSNAIIFCYEESLQPLGIFTWPYQGNTLTSQIPIALVTNAQYQGELSDPNGVITITNNQNSTLVVNCDFAFLNF